MAAARWSEAESWNAWALLFLLSLMCSTRASCATALVSAASTCPSPSADFIDWQESRAASILHSVLSTDKITQDDETPCGGSGLILSILPNMLSLPLNQDLPEGHVRLKSVTVSGLHTLTSADIFDPTDSCHLESVLTFDALNVTVSAVTHPLLGAEVPFNVTLALRDRVQLEATLQVLVSASAVDALHVDQLGQPGCLASTVRNATLSEFGLIALGEASCSCESPADARRSPCTYDVNGIDLPSVICSAVQTGAIAKVPLAKTLGGMRNASCPDQAQVAAEATSSAVSVSDDDAYGGKYLNFLDNATRFGALDRFLAGLDPANVGEAVACAALAASGGSLPYGDAVLAGNRLSLGPLGRGLTLQLGPVEVSGIGSLDLLSLLRPTGPHSLASSVSVPGRLKIGTSVYVSGSGAPNVNGAVLSLNATLNLLRLDAATEEVLFDPRRLGALTLGQLQDPVHGTACLLSAFDALQLAHVGLHLGSYPPSSSSSPAAVPGFLFSFKAVGPFAEKYGSTLWGPIDLAPFINSLLNASSEHSAALLNHFLIAPAIASANASCNLIGTNHSMSDDGEAHEDDGLLAIEDDAADYNTDAWQDRMLALALGSFFLALLVGALWRAKRCCTIRPRRRRPFRSSHEMRLEARGSRSSRSRSNYHRLSESSANGGRAGLGQQDPMMSSFIAMDEPGVVLGGAQRDSKSLGRAQLAPFAQFGADQGGSRSRTGGQRGNNVKEGQGGLLPPHTLDLSAQQADADASRLPILASFASQEDQSPNPRRDRLRRRRHNGGGAEEGFSDSNDDSSRYGAAEGDDDVDYFDQIAEGGGPWQPLRRWARRVSSEFKDHAQRYAAIKASAPSDISKPKSSRPVLASQRRPVPEYFRGGQATFEPPTVDDVDRLCLSPRFSPTTLVAFPAFCLLVIAIFALSNSADSSVDIVCHLEVGGNKPIVSFDSAPFFIFTLQSTIQDMWDAEVYPLAIAIAVFSCAWPYLKMLLVLFAWFAELRVGVREKLLHWIDVLGKWSLLDTYVMALMQVAFNFNIYLATNGVRITVYAKPKFGFVSFLFATALSLIAGHIGSFLHRLAASPVSSLPVGGYLEAVSAHRFLLAARPSDEGLLKAPETMEEGSSYTPPPIPPPPPPPPLPNATRTWAVEEARHAEETIPAGESDRSGKGDGVEGNGTAKPEGSRSNLSQTLPAQNSYISIDGQPSRRRLVRVSDRCRLLLNCVFALTLMSVIFGFVTDSYIFEFGGLTGWVLKYVAGSGSSADKQSYSVYSTFTALPDSQPQPNDLSVILIQATFIIFSFVVPMLVLVLLALLWTVPMSLRRQAGLLCVAEVGMCWSAVDVFIFSIVAALTEIQQFSEFIIQDPCGSDIVGGLSIDDLTKKFFNKHGVHDYDPRCLVVQTTLYKGCYALAVAGIAHFAVSEMFYSVAQTAVKDRVAKLLAVEMRRERRQQRRQLKIEAGERSLHLPAGASGSTGGGGGGGGGGNGEKRNADDQSKREAPVLRHDSEPFLDLTYGREAFASDNGEDDEDSESDAEEEDNEEVFHPLAENEEEDDASAGCCLS